MENNTINCSQNLFFTIKTLIVETETETYEFENIAEASISIDNGLNCQYEMTVDVSFNLLTSHLFQSITSGSVIKQLIFKGVGYDSEGVRACHLICDGPFTYNSSILSLDPSQPNYRITFTRLITGDIKTCAFYSVAISDDTQKKNISKHQNTLSIYKAHLDAQKQRRIPA